MHSLMMALSGNTMVARIGVLLVIRRRIQNNRTQEHSGLCHLAIRTHSRLANALARRNQARGLIGAFVILCIAYFPSKQFFVGHGDYLVHWNYLHCRLSEWLKAESLLADYSDLAKTGSLCQW
jgi:hypothetical protein